MGKKKRRLLSSKFAAWRRATGREIATDTLPVVEAEKISEIVIPETTVDAEILTTKDLMEESESDVTVIKNKAKESTQSDTPRPPTPEPQLQQVETDEPKRPPAGLKRSRVKTSTKRHTTKTKKD